jgi:hypothetical protein
MPFTVAPSPSLLSPRPSQLTPARQSRSRLRHYANYNYDPRFSQRVALLAGIPLTTGGPIPLASDRSLAPHKE